MIYLQFVQSCQGEPLNPEVIKWAKDVYGKRVLDTWWMTETGGHMIVNYPSMDIKLGSMGKPLPGIEAAIIDDEGNELPPIVWVTWRLRKVGLQ